MKLVSNETNELNISGNPNMWLSQISADRIGLLIPLESRNEVYDLETYSLVRDFTDLINSSIPKDIQSFDFLGIL